MILVAQWKRKQEKMSSRKNLLMKMRIKKNKQKMMKTSQLIPISQWKMLKRRENPLLTGSTVLRSLLLVVMCRLVLQSEPGDILAWSSTKD